MSSKKRGVNLNALTKQQTPPVAPSRTAGRKECTFLQSRLLVRDRRSRDPAHRGPARGYQQSMARADSQS